MSAMLSTMTDIPKLQCYQNDIFLIFLHKVTLPDAGHYTLNHYFDKPQI